MTPTAKQNIDTESHASWRQRSELRKMADMPPILETELSRLDEEFWVSKKNLKAIVKCFQEELDQGLSKHDANVPMHTTWIQKLPTGKEKGTFLTLDLGGTNLRVCKVMLKGGDKSDLDQEQYRLPEKLKTGNADFLWNWVTEKIADFLEARNLSNDYSETNPMPLGFTFSYPASQKRIDHAVLQTWTKGFDIQGVEGEDIADQLRQKLYQRHLPVELICVINDTVGAMVASAYNDSETIIGAIFGTGCNASYMASVKDLKKINKSELDQHNERIAINCEYGAFDNAHRILPRTRYDKKIDEESPRPGEQAFEKLSAGLYLGEIFRIILVDLADRNLIFQTQDTTKLRNSYSVDTGVLSQIEDDESPGFKTTRNLLESTLSLTPSDVEIELSRHVAELVAVRGARLCACGIAAICIKEAIRKGHVAADGSVANKHPKFKQRWAKALNEILDWEEESGGQNAIQITSAEDGSGVGCAIIAAMEIEKREKI